MFNSTIRSIIDLLKLKKDVKKTDLEIDKLSDEKKARTSNIHIASFDDIRRYDPRTAEVEALARRETPAFKRSPARTEGPVQMSRRPAGPLYRLVRFVVIVLVVFALFSWLVK